MELRVIIERLFLLYSIDDVKRANYLVSSAAFTTSHIEAVNEYLSHIEGAIFKTIKLPHKDK